MIPTATMGAVLAALLAGFAYLIWGAQAALAAGVFGAVAVGIQLAAIALIQPARQAAPKLFIKRWAMGMGLRLLGVVAIGLAVGLDRAHFPPVPTAVGFLGVILPLLLFEVRLVR